MELYLKSDNVFEGARMIQASSITIAGVVGLGLRMPCPSCFWMAKFVYVILPLSCLHMETILVPLVEEGPVVHPNSTLSLHH